MTIDRNKIRIVWNIVSNEFPNRDKSNGITERPLLLTYNPTIRTKIPGQILLRTAQSRFSGRRWNENGRIIINNLHEFPSSVIYRYSRRSLYKLGVK